MFKAYERLPYNLVVVRKDVKEFIEKKGLKLGPRFVCVDKKVVIKNIRFKNKEISLFIFPDLPFEKVENNFDKYSTLISQASSRSVTIGLVPWGVELEDKFLNSYTPDLDLLLGSGDGFSYFTKIGKTLWIHPCKEGICLYRIFEKRGLFYVERIDLDEAIGENPIIKGLIR